MLKAVRCAVPVMRGVARIFHHPDGLRRFLKEIHHHTHGWFYRVTEGFFQWMLRVYDHSLQWVLRYRPGTATAMRWRISGLGVTS